MYACIQPCDDLWMSASDIWHAGPAWPAFRTTREGHSTRQTDRPPTHPDPRPHTTQFAADHLTEVQTLCFERRPPRLIEQFATLRRNDLPGNKGKTSRAKRRSSQQLSSKAFRGFCHKLSLLIGSIIHSITNKEQTCRCQLSFSLSKFMPSGALYTTFR
jgi:hypothetical protein